jgi:hypothetical protein
MDIFYYIGLHADFITSININRTCCELFNKRNHFYQEKHQLLYNKPLIPIWTPEQSFYASNKKFTIFVEPYTLAFEISYLYENNNTINHMKNDDSLSSSYHLDFYLEHQFLLLYIVDSSTPDGHNSKLVCESYLSREQIMDLLKNKYTSGQYAIIDLNTIIPAWNKYQSNPKMDYTYHFINYNSVGKRIYTDY